jgi:hypothetical protein
MLPKSTSRKHLLAIACVLLSCSFCFGQNAIYTENQNPGVPFATWGIPADSFRAHNISGFATNMSLNAGSTVHFKVTVYDGANFTMKIYRIGYYNGNGARLIADLGTHPGVVQPVGIEDPVTGLLDCDNWSESASWAIPSNAVSGLYIARIDRVGAGGGSNHIAFVVRNDAGNSDLILQFPDATWQAYNVYGGNSIYNGTTAFPDGHATKVSYNRPFFIATAINTYDGRAADWYMNAEYPMIRFLERNGYDVSYTSCEDVSANPSHLLSHKVYISVGHDEYVSKEQRNAVEAARDAGVNLAFFSGNEFYWKTRYENDNSGDPRRTLVCYKEGLLATGQLGEKSCGTKCDLTSAEWTGLWRMGKGFDANRPENALTGQISWTELPGVIQVPDTYKNMRFWRNTSVASLGTGATANMAPNTLGYEWDYEQNIGTYPAGRMALSSTTVGGLTHKLSLYRHTSGALVFGAGTIQWSWGLDGAHNGGTSAISQDMQQATVNLFADMGAQPFSLMPGLTAATQSTDHTAPTSAILTPIVGNSFPARSTVNITGTVSDAGGVVSVVEVSVDGGTTWVPATIAAIAGSTTWSYSWIPEVQGAITIKVRGFDDSGNRETPGAGTTVSILPPVCPCTIMSPNVIPVTPHTNSDGTVIELGVKFRANVNGTVTGIRFYKDPNNSTVSGPHLGHLWTNTGTNLGQVTFTGETASGWQQALFATPISVVAGTTYVASYFSPTGHFSKTDNFFTATDYPAGSGWPVQALATPLNGVKRDGSSAFPNDISPIGENFLVDVVFMPNIVTTGTIDGSVTLQGRPAAPNAQWITPLVIKLYTPGVHTPLVTYNISTNSSGQFSIPNVPIGTYHISVRNVHTLQKVKMSQSIVAGTNTINFGTLPEGDGTGDNLVTLADISLLIPSFNKGPSDPGFNASVDYNNDGFVTLADISALISNFNTAGDPNP